MARLRTRHPELGLFLATDSNEVRRRVEALYPDVILADHWMPSDGAPLHRAKSCPDQAELAFAALVDVYLLANCDYLVVDEKSSLAHVAALLSRAHPARIYDVNIARWLPRPIRHPLWRVFNAAVVMGRHGPRALTVINTLIKQAHLNKVARELIERPRKTLDFETPAERFNACVASTG